MTAAEETLQKGAEANRANLAAEKEAKARLAADSAAANESKARVAADLAAKKEAKARLAAEREARVANAQRLTASGREALAENMPQRATLLAIEAAKVHLDQGETPVTEARQLLYDLLGSVTGTPLAQATAPRTVGMVAQGRWVVTRHDDNTNRLWDLAAERPFVTAFVDRGGIVTSLAPGIRDFALKGRIPDFVGVAIDPRGRWLAAAGMGGTVRLWDLTAEDPSKASITFRGHDGSRVDTLAIGPDGRWLATGGSDRTARLWDLSAEDPSKTSLVLRGHNERVRSLAFGPNGHWLVTRSDDNAVRLWDLTAEDPSKAGLAFEGQFSGVAFSPKGRWLIMASPDETRRLRVWDLTAEKPSKTSFILEGHKADLTAIATGPTDRWLATRSDDRAVRLWDLTAEGPTKTSFELLEGLKPPLGSDSAVVFSPDGHWLAAKDGHGSLHLFDLSVEDPSKTDNRLEFRGVRLIAIDPKGRWLITAGPENTARLLDLNAEDPAKTSFLLKEHLGPVVAVAFDDNGHWLATGSEDHTARLWDLTAQDPSKTSIVLKGHDAPLVSVVIVSNGRWVVTRAVDEAPRFWDLTAEDPAATDPFLRGYRGDFERIAIGPEGRWLVTVSQRSRTPLLWDLTAKGLNSPPIALQGHQLPFIGVAGVAFDAKGRWLGTLGVITARLWDLTAEDPSTRSLVFKDCGSGGRMRYLGGNRIWPSIAIDPQGRWLAATTRDNTARLWDLTSGDPPKNGFVLKGHEGTVQGVDIDPKGRWLATMSGLRPVRLWDLSAEDPSKTSFVLKGGGAGASFSATGRWFVTPNPERSGARPCLWDLTAEDPSKANIDLGKDWRSLTTVAFNPNGRWLVTLGWDQYSQGRLWDLTAEDPSGTRFVLNGQGGLGIDSAVIDSRGRRLVTTSGGTVKLWDLATEDPSKNSRVLRGHVGGVRAFAIDPEGRWLATAGDSDGTVRLWDLTAEDPSSTSVVLKGHESFVWEITMGPKGRWLVTEDTTLRPRLWHLDIEELIEYHKRLLGRALTLEERQRYLLTDTASLPPSVPLRVAAQDAAGEPKRTKGTVRDWQAVIERLDAQRQMTLTPASVREPALQKEWEAYTGVKCYVHAGDFKKIFDPSPSEKEPWWFGEHCFVRGPDQLWHVFGTVHPEPWRPGVVGKEFIHLTAKNLLDGPWKRQPPILRADREKHGETDLRAPHIVEKEGTYYMFYGAGMANERDGKIHLATSKDLYNWQRHPKNPMVVDSFNARDPVIQELLPNRWDMYYTATFLPAVGRERHALAKRTSTNLIDWGPRDIAYYDVDASSVMSSTTESPSVLLRKTSDKGNYYNYYFMGPRNRSGEPLHYRYNATDVFRMMRPQQLVGHIPAHGAEVVQDLDGTWYVSHCGAHQKGLYLAPLHWGDAALPEWQPPKVPPGFRGPPQGPVQRQPAPQAGQKKDSKLQ